MNQKNPYTLHRKTQKTAMFSPQVQIYSRVENRRVKTCSGNDFDVFNCSYLI